MTKDEQSVYDERLAILGCYGNPTPEQRAMALGDVERYQNERAREDCIADFLAHQDTE